MIEICSDVDVELVQHLATDASVVAAARVSTQGGLAEISERILVDQGEEGLIRFLMRERHGSPFEHSMMTFRVTAPIFVFREWHRHRTWSYNEESGRYKKLNARFYIPGKDRNLVQVGKAGAYTFEPGSRFQHWVMNLSMRALYRFAWVVYILLLKVGIAREVARMVLPVGIYSTMYATCDARALMDFLSLRTQSPLAEKKSYPQREIEMAAEKAEILWSLHMPATHRAFNDFGRVKP